MKVFSKVFILTVCLFAATASLAQDTPPPTQTFCKDTAGFSDWDFWVGDWNVVSNDAAKTPFGKNSITKHYENCLIKETWESASGGGFSVNFYNPVKQQWRQVWVANAYSIDYAGGLNEQGQMVLKGELYDYQQNSTSPFKGSWTPESNGDVIQRFEVLNAATGQWDVWFEGRYIRQ
jgi:hypothetical protein